jgi:AcrR family transcriptional regulator
MPEATTRRAMAADETRRVVVASARRCFARFGVDKTTMEDIAREAGVARSGVYRLFDSRAQIIEEAIRARVAELAVELRRVLESTAGFEEALVEVSLATVHVARNDHEFRDLVDSHTDLRIHDVLSGHQTELHEFILRFWAPTFAAARSTGALRDTVTDDEIVEWLSGVWMMLAQRTDLTDAAERRILREFVLPSLLTRDHGAG